MKHIYTILLSVLLSTNLFTLQFVRAQVPEKMSYQAVIRKANNELAINHNIGMQISLLQNSETGAAVYIERQFPTTNGNGLVSFEIGSSDAIVVKGDFSSIDWSSNLYFIKTETDLNGGANYTITTTSQLLSIPYALHAKTADGLTGAITETDPIYATSEAANITTTDIINLSNLSGTNSGDQDISGIAINTQAIKDTASQIRADIPDVSGFITNETQNLLQVLTQNNDAGTKQIKNIADPTDAQDAVTKAYVDALLERVEVLEVKDLLQNGLTDSRDGNNYNVVKIGDQIWMAENLAYLPEVQNHAEYKIRGDAGEPAYGVADYDGNDVTLAKSNTNYDTYGVLYNWYVVDQTNVCPSGWHVPTDDEWKTLEMTLGMSQSDANNTGYRGTNQGAQLAGNANLWTDGDLDANANFGTSGLNALPGGWRVGLTGISGSKTEIGYWWCRNQFDSEHGYHRYLYYNSTLVYRSGFRKNSGLSIRCVKD